ncbi:nicotinate-nucleotide pyrophosphorylase [carboxylating], chloroplastic [Tanacetum coccineum]
MCSSFDDSLYTNMNKVYYAVRRAAAEAREAHEAGLGLLESLLNENMSSGHNIPQDSPGRITKIVPSDVNDLSCWTTVYERSGDTFVSCIDIGEMEYYENDLKHPYLIDNEVSALHQSPNNRLYMLPSTPLVLLESMGPYGSTGLDAAEKNATLLIDLCCSSCMHFGNKKDGSSTVFGGRVLIGEGQNHGMGLFDTLMIKDNHTCVVGGVSNALKSVDLYLKNNNLQMGVKLLYETKNHKQQVDNDIPFVSFGDFDSPSLEKVQSKVTYEDELPAAERYESDDSFGEPASPVVRTFRHPCFLYKDQTKLQRVSNERTVQAFCKCICKV